MRKLCILSVCLLTFAASALAKPSPRKTAPPDRVYLQAVWMAGPRSILRTSRNSYATGPHAFFDIAPLKYNSWDEYENGVKAVLAGYKSAKFTLNDDLAIHPHGDLAWATATVKEEMTTKAGKVDMGNFRWTAVLEIRMASG